MTPEHIIVGLILGGVALWWLDVKSWKPRTKTHESKSKPQMPPGWKMLTNDYSFAYRRPDGWINYSFKTSRECSKRAWEDFETQNYKDDDGKTYREMP